MWIGAIPILSVVAVAAVPAGAQTVATPVSANEPDAASPKPADEEAAAGEIIVTARRRAESDLSVPIAISVASSEQLRAANVVQLAEVGRIAPALRIVPTAGRSNVLTFSLRGQNDASALITSDPAVGIYFADAIQTRTQGAGRSLYDIGSIQVLKGPQGTLFGRNLTGGAVLIQPNAPELDAVSGYGRLTYGSYDRREAQGALNLPLGGVAALRLAGNITRRDGYVTNLTTGTKQKNDHTDSVRGSLLIQPSTDFKNTLIIDYYKGRNLGGGFIPAAINPAVNLPFNTFAARDAVFKRQLARSFYTVEETTTSPSSSRNLGVTNSSEFSFIPNVTIKNVLNFREVRSSDLAEEGLPQDIVRVLSKVKAHQFTNELQVIGAALDNRLKYITGGYFFWETGLQRGFVSTFGGAPRVTEGDATNESKSLFAQVDFDIIRQLTATAGIRYTWDDRRLNQLVVSPQGTTLVNGTATVSFSKPTWTLSLSYKPSDDLLFYVTNRRGYRSGGFNAGGITPAAALVAVRPEILTDYEAGLKIAGLTGDFRYRASVAAYHSVFDDIQRSLVSLAGNPPAPTRVLLNAAKARINGAEGEFSVSAWSRIDLTASFGYTDAKYTKFDDPLTGADLSDRPFSQTPKWTYRFGGRAVLLQGAVGELAAGLDYVHTSGVLGDGVDIRPAYIVPAYGLLNGRISYDDIGASDISVALFATNLTNKKYALSSVPFYDAPFGLTAYVTGEPRMYGVEVGFRF